MTEAETPDKSNQKLSPGAALSRARQARQMSVAETASQLKLPKTTIEHIEADQFDRIAPIYRRGYIVNYARLVELDHQPLLDQMGELEPEPLRAVLPAAGKPQRFDRFLKFATYALVTTMIVPPLVYFFVLGGARLFESEVASRATDASGVQTAQDSRPGYRERFADALAVQPPDATRNDASHLSASALPMNPIRTPVRPEAAAEAAGALGAEETAPVNDPTASLELELTDDSWIEIESADGQRLEFDLLRSGETRQYTGLAPFKLLLGRASAVSLTLDGQAVTFDGQDEAGVAELVVGEPAPAAPPGRAGDGSAAE